MSAKPGVTGKSAIPMARPAPPRVQVEGHDNEPAEEAVLLTPAGIKGWAISAGLHALLLVILALWVFSPPKKGPPTIDTRLAGSEFGVPEGLNTLGGVDTPITIPDPPRRRHRPTRRSPRSSPTTSP